MPRSRSKPHDSVLRDLIARAGVVVLAIVLLRWFAFGVYRIPTPSMQPLLLGCLEADAHDRVFVDRLAYCWRQPERWQVIAFRSPLQQRQEVAKRLVGLPGEHLRIAGGNLYTAGDPTAAPHILRKPDGVQEQSWREVYPLRRRLRAEDPGLLGSFRATPANAARETDAGAIEVAAGTDCTITFADGDGGLVDRAWDGLPAAVARALRDRTRETAAPTDIVPDAKIAVRVHTAREPERLALQLTIRRPGREPLGFALVLAAGMARFTVAGAAAALAASDPVPCPVAGDGTEIAFAHVDDELVAWRNGTVLARYDVAAWPCSDGCELPPAGPKPPEPSADHGVALDLRVRAAVAVALDDLRVWRDVHYTRGALPSGDVVVPTDHYFVLGDNPRASEDSRGWNAIELGEDATGTAVTPAAGVRRLRGALRFGDADLPPTAEENPVLVPERGLALFVDDLGEPHRLALVGGASGHFGSLRLGDGDRAFEPPISTVHFVARELVTGRVVARLWPVPPFGTWRPGWVR